MGKSRIAPAKDSWLAGALSREPGPRTPPWRLARKNWTEAVGSAGICSTRLGTAFDELEVEGLILQPGVNIGRRILTQLLVGQAVVGHRAVALPLWQIEHVPSPVAGRQGLPTRLKTFSSTSKACSPCSPPISILEAGMDATTRACGAAEAASVSAWAKLLWASKFPAGRSALPTS